MVPYSSWDKPHCEISGAVTRGILHYLRLIYIQLQQSHIKNTINNNEGQIIITLPLHDASIVHLFLCFELTTMKQVHTLERLCVPRLVGFLVLAVSFASAFVSPTPSRRSSFGGSSRVSRQMASAETTTPSFPALSREQIESLLADIPIFAVTDTKREGGMVLLNEPNNENSIAYFFLSPETANAVYAPLRAKQEQAGTAVSWDVTQFSLGLVWFELLDNPGTAKNGVEYRLVPSARQVTAARSMLQQIAQQAGSNAAPNMFGELGYNQVPIFIDQRLRVQTENDGQDKVPLYFGIEDLLQTFQQVQGGKSKEQPMVSVAELFSVVKQMQQDDCVTDFSKAVFVASTESPAPLQSRKKKMEEPTLPWEKSNNEPKKDAVNPLNLSTTDTDAWAD